MTAAQTILQYQWYHKHTHKPSPYFPYRPFSSSTAPSSASPKWGQLGSLYILPGVIVQASQCIYMSVILLTSYCVHFYIYINYVWAISHSSLRTGVVIQSNLFTMTTMGKPEMWSLWTRLVFVGRLSYKRNISSWQMSGHWSQVGLS